MNAVFNMPDEFLSWHKWVESQHFSAECPYRYFSKTIPAYVSV